MVQNDRQLGPSYLSLSLHAREQFIEYHFMYNFTTVLQRGAKVRKKEGRHTHGRWKQEPENREGEEEGRHGGSSRSDDGDDERNWGGQRHVCVVVLCGLRLIGSSYRQGDRRSEDVVEKKMYGDMTEIEGRWIT
jgi:hypothetical protein